MEVGQAGWPRRGVVLAWMCWKKKWRFVFLLETEAGGKNLRKILPVKRACPVEELEVERADLLAVDYAGGRGLHRHYSGRESLSALIAQRNCSNHSRSDVRSFVKTKACFMVVLTVEDCAGTETQWDGNLLISGDSLHSGTEISRTEIRAYSRNGLLYLGNWSWSFLGLVQLRNVWMHCSNTS